MIDWLDDAPRTEVLYRGTITLTATRRELSGPLGSQGSHNNNNYQAFAWVAPNSTIFSLSCRDCGILVVIFFCACWHQSWKKKIEKSTKEGGYIYLRVWLLKKMSFCMKTFKCWNFLRLSPSCPLTTGPPLMISTLPHETYHLWDCHAHETFKVVLLDFCSQ